MRNNQRNIFAVLLILWSCAIGGNVLAQTAPYKMWYDKPAQFWEEALPIGNGRISAMVYGDPYTGRFQLNEETVSAGSPYQNYNKEGKAALSQIRKLIFERKYEKAQELGGESCCHRLEMK